MKLTPTVLNAIKVFEEFRKLDPEMQMQTALIFLLIANNEGCSISDLEKWTGLTECLLLSKCRGAVGHPPQGPARPQHDCGSGRCK